MINTYEFFLQLSRNGPIISTAMICIRKPAETVLSGAQFLGVGVFLDAQVAHLWHHIITFQEYPGHKIAFSTVAKFSPHPNDLPLC